MNDPIRLDLGYRVVFMLTSYKWPIVYIFAKIVVTDFSIGFRLIPFIPLTTYSLPLNGISYYKRKEGSINVYMDNGVFAKFFANGARLDALEGIFAEKNVGKVA